MSSYIVNSFTTSFPTQIPFISFSCLIALSGTTSRMLNGSGKSRHLYLVSQKTLSTARDKNPNSYLAQQTNKQASRECGVMMLSSGPAVNWRRDCHPEPGHSGAARYCALTWPVLTVAQASRTQQTRHTPPLPTNLSKMRGPPQGPLPALHKGPDELWPSPCPDDGLCEVQPKSHAF